MSFTYTHIFIIYGHILFNGKWASIIGPEIFIIMKLIYEARSERELQIGLMGTLAVNQKIKYLQSYLQSFQLINMVS